MSQGNRITAKWHATRWGEPPEKAKKKEGHSVREKLKAQHEAVYGKPKISKEKPEE